MVCFTGTYLDPADEDHDGEGGVEGELPVGETVEVGVVVGLGQQPVQLFVHLRRAVDAEDDAEDGDQDHNDVEDVPERLEVRQTNLLDLRSAHPRPSFSF